MAASPDPDHLEGDSKTPTVSVLVEFPSVEAAQAFYEDPDYAPHLKARLGGSTSDLWLLDGL